MITANFDIIATLHEKDLIDFLQKYNFEKDIDFFDIEDIIENELRINYDLGEFCINGMKVISSDNTEMDFFDWFEIYLKNCGC